MKTWETQGERGWEGDYEVHSLFVDRNHKVLLAEHVDSRRPLPNTLVTCSLAGAHSGDPVSDGPLKTGAQYSLLDRQLLIEE